MEDTPPLLFRLLAHSHIIVTCLISPPFEGNTVSCGENRENRLGNQILGGQI